MKKPNFYGIGKGILSSGIVLSHWWKKEYNLYELVPAFGIGALQRGIDQAKANGEEVPARAIYDLTAYRLKHP